MRKWRHQADTKNGFKEERTNTLWSPLSSAAMTSSPFDYECAPSPISQAGAQGEGARRRHRHAERTNRLQPKKHVAEPPATGTTPTPAPPQNHALCTLTAATPPTLSSLSSARALTERSTSRFTLFSRWTSLVAASSAGPQRKMTSKRTQTRGSASGEAMEVIPHQM